MKKNFYVLAFLFATLLPGLTKAQCTIPTSAGYSIFIKITAAEIIPTAACVAPPYPGYNYNVKFDWKVSIYGTNNTYNANVQIQPTIVCNSQSNSYFSIEVPAPIVGNPYAVNDYYGTVTTGSNPYRTTNDCGNVTPMGLPCTSLSVNVGGPGVSVSNQTCNVIILPVSISNFTANCINEKILLNWLTTNESNNAGFEIERSLDAANWLNVGTIKGAGNSNRANNYSFTDSKLDIDKVFYRLKQVDFDGNFKYSGVVTVQNCSKTKSDLLVYPKPSNGLLNVVYTSDKFNIASIEIYNSTGQRVYLANSFQPTINLYKQPNGVYYLKLTRKDNTAITQKIFIAK